MIRPQQGEAKRRLQQLYRWEGGNLIKQLLATDLISPLEKKQQAQKRPEGREGQGRGIQGNPLTMGLLRSLNGSWGVGMKWKAMAFIMEM